MKRTNALTTLLNGNTKKKTKLAEKANFITEAIEHGNEDDTTLDSIIESSSPLKEVIEDKPIKHITPVGDSANSQSVKNFLMSRPKKIELKKANGTGKARNKPIVISLDEDEDSFLMGDDINIISENVTNINHVNDDDEDIIVSASTVVSDPQNSKKVKLKDLFGSFKKPDNINNDTIGRNETTQGPLKRLNDISKLKSLDAPFPKCQMIFPNEDDYSPLRKDKVQLHLPKKKDNIQTPMLWTTDDYLLLNKNSPKDQ